MPQSPKDDSWSQEWNEKVHAIEGVLGKSENTVLHAMVPFQLGGFADVIWFKRPPKGRVFVTCELLGEEGQIQNELGNYELAAADRHGSDHMGNLISRLARYTCDAKLNPRDTMDIGGAVPKGSTITALLFLEFGRFEYAGKDAGLLLCMGITASELEACRAGRKDEVIDALAAADVFPYTDWERKSVVA